MREYTRKKEMIYDKKQQVFDQEIHKEIDSLIRKVENLIFFRNAVILIIIALITLAYINRSGAYPWGSDTYGHLFKSNILYDSIRKGSFFLNYHESWYNGIQPFRYWAPLPYYVLAIVNLFVHNIIVSFNVYIVILFMIGGLGWLCFGYYLHRQNLGLIVAVLWFFVPNNLRILFSEGNLPFSLFIALIPFVLLYYFKTRRENKIVDYLLLAFFMGIITLTHAMLAGMMGLSLLMLVVIETSMGMADFKRILSLIYAFLGIMVTGFWLYPALKGGIVAIDQSAVAEVMKSLTYPITESLNPMLRIVNIEVYYFGLSFAIVAVFGLLFSTRNERAPCAASLLILAGTTKLVLPLMQQLPMNQLFWMSRFTSIAMALIFTAILQWKSIRKSVLAGFILLLIADSGVSFYLLAHNGKAPVELSSIIDKAVGISTQRIGVLDDSTFGSFPSYYIAYPSVAGAVDQVYGWAWQGATTSQNIVAINTALENGYYGYLFDRVLELGADTLIVRKAFIKDYNMLASQAKASRYEKYYEDNNVMIYKYPVTGNFGTKVDYKGFAIGSYAPNITYLFPEIQAGSDKYVDDYSYEELKTKSVLFLSGFDYRNKEAAEALLKRLSSVGVRVVVDIEGLRDSFLGVTPQPIIIKNNYKNIVYKGTKLNMKAFPEGFESWKAYFMNGLDNKQSYAVEDFRVIQYIGSKYSPNLTFLGLNLPYFAFLTKDGAAVDILEEALGIKAYVLPKRVLYPISIIRQGNRMMIKSSTAGVIVPLAALDAFDRVRGNYGIVDHLICMKTNELSIRIIYPYLRLGTAISVVFLTIEIALSIVLFQINRSKERKERFKHRFHKGV